MKQRAFLPLVAAAVLTSGLVAANALAGPHHMGPGYRGGYYGVEQQAPSPEKQQQYTAIMKDFAEKTQALRDKIQAKQIELDTLGNSINPNPEAVSKASQELVALQNQFNKERAALTERLSKEMGVAPYSGWGHIPGCPGGPGCFGYRGGMMMDGNCGYAGRGYHHGYGHYGW